MKFGRGGTLVADIEELETMDASEIYSKRLNAKKKGDRTRKLVKSEDIRVMHAHDGTGEPVKSSANTHSARSWFSRTS